MACFALGHGLSGGEMLHFCSRLPCADACCWAREGKDKATGWSRNAAGKVGILQKSVVWEKKCEDDWLNIFQALSEISQ